MTPSGRTSRSVYTTHEHPRRRVGLVITKQADANTLQTAPSRADGRAAAPAHAARQASRLTVTNDTSRYVRYAVDAVQKDLVLAIIITGVDAVPVPAHLAQHAHRARLDPHLPGLARSC